jgi:hypothetical protein
MTAWADFAAAHPLTVGCAVPSCEDPAAFAVEMVAPCGHRSGVELLCARHRQCCDAWLYGQPNRHHVCREHRTRWTGKLGGFVTRPLQSPTPES